MAGRAVDVLVRVDASTQGASSKLTALGRVGKGAGAAVAAGALVAGAASAKLAVDSVKAASAAQQSIGATQTVFGRYADLVIKRSNDAAKAIGLSANEYRELSNVMGASLRGVGFPLEQTANLTENLNKRAADMAATFGGTTREAVEAIGSLMRGEADPIERYGVSIKAVDVAARLAATGQDELTGSALKQAESLARLDLLFEKTAITQGAFAKESGTLANQQQVLGAQIENLQVKLGQKLLPVLTRLATYANEKVIPGIEKWAGVLAERLGPYLTEVRNIIVNRVVPGAQSLYRWFVEKIVPGLRDTLAPVLDGARSAFAKVSGAVSDNSEELGTLRDWLGKAVEFVVNRVGPIYGKYLKHQLEAAATAFSVVVSTVATLVRWLETAYNKASSLITMLGNLKDKAGSIPGLGALGSGLSNLGGVVGRVTGNRVAAPSYSTRVTIQGGGLYDEPRLAQSLQRVLMDDARRKGATLYRPSVGFV